MSDSTEVDLTAQTSLIPIIIGVTGHRDLQPSDITPLEDRVKEIVTSLRDAHPATPLLVLSPLAEGADRLVARVALEHGAKLIVPLPFSRSEYEKDFETDDSKKDFRELLKLAWKCFELPLAPGNSIESIRQKGPERNRQYTQAGAYIVRHSHILIALWDSAVTGLEGGTERIIDFKLNGIPAPYAGARKPLDIVDNGPVYHILTPRLKNRTPKGEPFSLEIKFPEGWTSSSESLEKSYKRILEQMNAFNVDAERLAAPLAQKVNKNREYVIPELKAASLSQRARFILDRYAMADTLALYFKTIRKRILLLLFTIAVAAVLSFEIYAHLLGEPFVLLLYPLSLGAAVALYALAKWKDYQNKHLDYRALAEGLRVQLFWHLAGLNEDVAEHYLRQHRTELEWIRNAIRAWSVIAEESCSPEAPQPLSNDANPSAPKLTLIAENWIEDQRNFFSTSKDHRRLIRHERTAKVLFFFGLLLAAVVVIMHFLSPEFGEHSFWRHSLIVIMGITPAIAAAIGGYAEKMAYSAQAKRYDWMNSLYDRAAVQLAKLMEQQDAQGARQLIFDLGKEALEENGDWVMIHRERTADVYKGA
ncbi:MAG TPA: hypothetical protein VN643_07645 [Pyrinomonadaceae bacterium]|nr:hypothetical protein [Pyrinomonadaceae bacterium]